MKDVDTQILKLEKELEELKKIRADEAQKYPCVKKSLNSDLVVFFVEKGEGFVLKDSFTIYNKGDYSKFWKMDEFTTNNYDIALKRED